MGGVPLGRISYYDIGVQFHRSAFKHDFDTTAILHALEHAIVFVDLDHDSDPPKMLAIGPDPAGNLLEVIWVQLEEEDLVIHAMALRPVFYDLLPQGDDDL